MVPTSIAECKQGGSLTVTITLTNNGSAMSPSAATMTLRDQATGAIINNRNATDILSSVSAGVATINLVAADNPAIGSKRVERHVLTATFTQSNVTARAELFIDVTKIDA